MSKLFIFFSFLLFGCNGKRTFTSDQKDQPVKSDTITKSFSFINKDHADIINYQFKKNVIANGIVSYSYYNSKDNFFIILCDTVNGIYKAIFTPNDTSTLFLESEKFYRVNDVNFKVRKLVEGKDITDGEVSYFFDMDAGLLLSKSNTWRTGKILNPDQHENSYLSITALLYKVLTDDIFFNYPIPKSNIKFTPPKVE